MSGEAFIRSRYNTDPSGTGSGRSSQTALCTTEVIPDQSQAGSPGPTHGALGTRAHGGLPAEWPTATLLTTPPGGSLTMGQAAEAKHTSETSRRTHKSQTSLCLQLCLPPAHSCLIVRIFLVLVMGAVRKKRRQTSVPFEIKPFTHFLCWGALDTPSARPTLQGARPRGRCAV